MEGWRGWVDNMQILFGKYSDRIRFEDFSGPAMNPYLDSFWLQNRLPNYILSRPEGR